MTNKRTNATKALINNAFWFLALCEYSWMLITRKVYGVDARKLDLGKWDVEVRASWKWIVLVCEGPILERRSSIRLGQVNGNPYQRWTTFLEIENDEKQNWLHKSSTTPQRHVKFFYNHLEAYCASNVSKRCCPLLEPPMIFGYQLLQAQ